MDEKRTEVKQTWPFIEITEASGNVTYVRASALEAVRVDKEAGALAGNGLHQVHVKTRAPSSYVFEMDDRAVKEMIEIAGLS